MTKLMKSTTTFSKGDVVRGGTGNLLVVLEMMDDELVWACGLKDSKSVSVIETSSLKFVSKGGLDRCARLQRKAHRFPVD
jgi:hypothetical protein